MAFPATIDAFTPRVDDEDYVLSDDINLAYGDGVSNGGIEAIENKLGIDSSAVATSIDYLLKSASSVDPGHKHQLLVDFFVSATTKLYHYANTALTGWTIEAVTDAVLAVKGGSQAYNVTGGQQGGTWTQPSHALTTNEIPEHTHGGVVGSSGGQNIGSAAAPAVTIAGTSSVNSTTESAHTHGTTYRPYACVGIIMKKT